MSYDLQIAVKVQDYGEYVPIAYPENSSPTYNLGTMFRECMDWDFKQGVYYKCSEVVDNIDKGINELTWRPEKYKHLEAENGWGTIKGALEDLEYLRECIVETSRRVPVEYLYVSW